MASLRSLGRRIAETEETRRPGILEESLAPLLRDGELPVGSQVWLLDGRGNVVTGTSREYSPQARPGEHVFTAPLPGIQRQRLVARIPAGR